MKNSSSSPLANYLARQEAARTVVSVAKDQLAATLVTKVVVRTAIIGLSTALFLLVSPVAGFATLAVLAFLL